MPLSEVHKALGKFAAEQTFTKNALKDFELTIAQVKALEDENIKLIDERTELKTQVRELTNTVNVQKTELDNWRTSETNLREREKKITQLEKDSACSNVRAETYRSMFDSMFKNTIVREKFTDSVYENSNGPNGYTNNNKTVTQERETTKE